MFEFSFGLAFGNLYKCKKVVITRNPNSDKIIMVERFSRSRNCSKYRLCARERITIIVTSIVYITCNLGELLIIDMLV